ncbi:MAG: hypothetical protein QOI47_2414, partial [Actinomycetota bacterium]|nr:hypothetical protein [Actinomycetota bacterium]
MSRIRSAGFEERLGQDQTSPMWSEHLARYRHPLTSRGARVLDVACGAGVGLLAMSMPPRVVVGADADRPALLDARRLVGAARLVQVDAGALPFPSGAFDLVTSFETVEHVQDDRRM